MNIIKHTHLIVLFLVLMIIFTVHVSLFLSAMSMQVPFYVILLSAVVISVITSIIISYFNLNKKIKRSDKS